MSEQADNSQKPESASAAADRNEEIYQKYKFWVCLFNFNLIFISLKSFKTHISIKFIQIRDCSVYKSEHKECKSIKGRFNQYFIFGESLDCENWRNDYNNCQRLNWLGDKEAAVKVIESEMQRRANRLKTHDANDTWTRRDKPPEDWSKPLPQFMIERNANSYLEMKGKEYAEEQERLRREDLELASKPNDNINKNSFCTFM